MSGGRGFLEDKFDAPSVRSDDNHFLLSLIPYEKTTTYKKGTRHGPEAIVEASGHIELLDETLRVDASTYGIETIRPAITDLRSITAHVASLAKKNEGRLLGFLGGEHSVTPAIVEGFGGQDIGIVWIDAHADLRQSYMGRENNHACAGYHTQAFGPIVQVGIRSLAEEEVHFLDGSDRVRCFPHWSDEVASAIRALPERVYMSIDVDGLNPMLIRAVGTPEPGGLLWEETLAILDFVFSEKDVFAYDVVELCPNEDDVVSNFTTARLVYKVMQYHAYHKLATGR